MTQRPQSVKQKTVGNPSKPLKRIELVWQANRECKSGFGSNNYTELYSEKDLEATLRKLEQIDGRVVKITRYYG
jgi:hypothetical protein